MKLSRKRLIRAAALAAGIALGTIPTTVFAQQAGQSQMKLPSQSAGTAKIADAQLRTYAKAADDVREISKAYVPKMQKAKDPQTRASIRKQAQSKMVAAIGKRGLTVKKYNRITLALRKDPQLANRVRKMMRQVK